MANKNRLVNRAQLRNVGTHLREDYVHRDVEMLQEAIQTLRERLDYITDKYSPEMDKKLQSKHKMSDFQYANWKGKVADLPGDKFQRIQDIINDQETDSQKNSSNDNDTSHDDKKAPSDKDSDDKSHHQDDDNHESQNKDHGNRDNDDTSSDDSHPDDEHLDFLNKMNQ